MKINTFDIDGVIYFGENHTGVRPHPIDIIVTGRSFQQEEETEKMLEKFEIRNKFAVCAPGTNLRHFTCTVR